MNKLEGKEISTVSVSFKCLCLSSFYAVCVFSDIWDRLSKVFPNIWVASAFKGATGACIYATNIMYHVDNHLTWLSVLERVKSKFENIRGIALTGWQR